MTKYIHKQNGKYVFEKKTNGKRVIISCPNLETAIDIRDIYSKHDWYMSIPEPAIFKTREIFYVLYRPEKRTKILLKTEDFAKAKSFIDTYIDTSNIKDDKNKFSIIKSIKNKNTSFGNYNSLEEAIKFRDLYRSHNWDYEYFKEVYKTSEQQQRKYIYNIRNRYVIRRKDPNGVQRTYGSFASFEEAKKQRDQLIKNGWKLESNSYITSLFGRYWIYYPHRNGERIYRNFYDCGYDLDEIKQIRDKYIENGFPEKPLFSTDCLRYISKIAIYWYIEKKNKRFWGNKDLLKVIDVRDLLENNGWAFRSGEYIINGNVYEVTVDVDGKSEIEFKKESDYNQFIKQKKGKFLVESDGLQFGDYSSLKDAIEVCRVMCRFKWNIDFFNAIFL